MPKADNNSTIEDVLGQLPSKHISEFPLSDAGNAERMAYLYGSEIRYCAQWRKWLIWDGSRWEMANDGASRVYQMAIDTVRQIQKDALEETEPDARKRLNSWGFKCEDKAKLEAMITLCAKMPGVPILAEELDTHPHLLNLLNGTYNLDTHELEVHSREHLLTARMDVAYDPEAKCPEWRKFLVRVLEEKPDLLKYIWKATGCTLDGSKSEKCFFFLYGPGGDNGKSTLVETLHLLFGEYARNMTTESLMAKQSEQTGANSDIARLRGMRLVAAPETQDGRRLNEQLIKQITGNDTITARFLFQEASEFKPQFMVWMHGNHRPEIRGTDDAIWGRIKLIPFNVRIPKAEQDPDLGNKLARELPGILTWAINGHKAWRKEGLGEPEEIREAVAEYRGSEDRLGTFLDECIIKAEAGTFSIQCSAMHAKYSEWAKARNEIPISMTKFGKTMRERGMGSEEEGSYKVYKGMRFKGQND